MFRLDRIMGRMSDLSRLDDLLEWQDKNNTVVLTDNESGLQTGCRPAFGPRANAALWAELFRSSLVRIIQTFVC
jgi:hypothetical protein